MAAKVGPAARRSDSFPGHCRGIHPPDLPERFVRAGWRARASSWTDYEVEHEWLCIELVESSPKERPFSGVVDPARVDELAAVLAGLGLRYAIELWSDDGTTLLRELAG